MDMPKKIRLRRARNPGGLRITIVDFFILLDDRVNGVEEALLLQRDIALALGDSVGTGQP